MTGNGEMGSLTPDSDTRFCSHIRLYQVYTSRAGQQLPKHYWNATIWAKIWPGGEILRPEMKPEFWSRLKPIFDKAVALEGEELQRFLDEECVGDAELVEQLKKLLAGDKAAGEFLSVPALLPSNDAVPSALLQPTQPRFRN